MSEKDSIIKNTRINWTRDVIEYESLKQVIIFGKQKKEEVTFMDN